MHTVQAEYRTDIARLVEDMAKREVQRTAREATARWWQTAVILAGIGIAATFVISYG